MEVWMYFIRPIGGADFKPSDGAGHAKVLECLRYGGGGFLGYVPQVLRSNISHAECGKLEALPTTFREQATCGQNTPPLMVKLAPNTRGAEYRVALKEGTFASGQLQAVYRVGLANRLLNVIPHGLEAWRVLVPWDGLMH
jgi:hypothetical protein